MPERARSYRLWCVLLLLLSVVTRLALGLLTPNGMNLVDLHVYVDGSAALLSGELYDFTYSRDTPDFPLPFTYPPFAALVFLPLHYLPFGVLGILWLLLTIAALFWVIRIALDLLVGPVARGSRWTSVALVWTAIAVWIEPVRTTLDYGQINVFLVLAVMLAVRSNRWWLSGGLVGIVAGIKLTPAITGVYFLARRRWREAFFSAVVFGATVAVSSVLLGEQARTYFTSMFGDAIGSARWDRSGTSHCGVRSVGFSAVTWIRVRCGSSRSRVRGPRVRGLAVTRPRRPSRHARHRSAVRFVGVADLVGAPLGVGRTDVAVARLRALAGRLGTRVVAVCWGAVTLVGVPWVLSTFQASMWDIDRPAPLAWLGAVNVVGVLVVYLWMIVAPRWGSSDSVTVLPAHRSCEPDPDRPR